MRPDYCPQANEPCQAMCEKPCVPIGRLKVEKLEPLSLEEILSMDCRITLDEHIRVVRMTEAAHNAKLGGAK